jgi:hypothetical protein
MPLNQQLEGFFAFTILDLQFKMPARIGLFYDWWWKRWDLIAPQYAES